MKPNIYVQLWYRLDSIQPYKNPNFHKLDCVWIH